MGEFKVTVEQQRTSLTNLFTLIMDFIELFVQHTRGELRSHQGVLREILEAAQNSEPHTPSHAHQHTPTKHERLGVEAGTGTALTTGPCVCSQRRNAETATALDDKISELRPFFREDFLTFLQDEYARVTKPPMSEEAVVLANLLQAIRARVLSEVGAPWPHQVWRCAEGLVG
jgi:hypothetical protein